MFKKINNDMWLNLDNVIEFLVVPCCFGETTKYKIYYWWCTGEQFELPFSYYTKEEAQEALDKFMGG